MRDLLRFNVLKRVSRSPWSFYPQVRAGEGKVLLTDSRSLTKLLTTKFKQKPVVKVLFEGWSRPSIEEMKCLDMVRDQLVWVRETEICIDDEAIIMARSVFPPSVIRGRYRRLRFMRERSLSKLLFSRSSIQRKSVWFEQGDEKNVSMPVRHSIFTLNGYPMLLSEWFLSAMNKVL